MGSPSVSPWNGGQCYVDHLEPSVMIFECPVVSHRKICHEYILRTLECLNIEPGICCKEFNDNMDRKSNMHKCRNSTVEFKRRRSQLNKQSDASRKETKEGRTYESNVRLNLNLSETSGEFNTTMSITELCAVHITETVQEKYENAVPKFAQRPSIRDEIEIEEENT